MCKYKHKCHKLGIFVYRVEGCTTVVLYTGKLFNDCVVFMVDNCFLFKL